MSESTGRVGDGEYVPNARHTDNTRLEAFSDAIFGFAATLLVVSLDVPTSYKELVKNLQGFIVFGLSFAMLVSIWTKHREFFKQFPLGDDRTILLNTLLLFVILFFVYPLKFLMRVMVIFLSGGRLGGAGPDFTMGQSELAGMFTIYGFGWMAVFGCFALLYHHAAKRAEVLDFGPNDVQLARDRRGHYAIMSSIGLVSVALSLMNVAIRFGGPGWVYMLIGPALGWYWSWRRRSATVIPSEARDLSSR